MAEVKIVMDSSLARDVLSRHKPPSWSNKVPRREVLQELTNYSPEFISAKNKIKPIVRHVDVCNVFRVENPYLFGSYLLKKEEYIKRYGSCRELELFHATDIANVLSITTDNLDWRRSVRTKFGGGVSFSPCPNYANTYCNRSCSSSIRAMIIAQVLVCRTCAGYGGMELPPRTADTSTGNGGKVYVKYNDNEFYPQYVAYYRGNCL